MFSLAPLVLPVAQTPGNPVATNERFELTLEATPHNARQLRARFQQWLQTLGAPAALVDDLTLAIYQALANVVEHAYPSDHPDPLMHLHARVQRHQVLIIISDHGRWRRPPTHPATGAAV